MLRLLQPLRLPTAAIAVRGVRRRQRGGRRLWRGAADARAPVLARDYARRGALHRPPDAGARASAGLCLRSERLLAAGLTASQAAQRLLYAKVRTWRRARSVLVLELLAGCGVGELRRAGYY